jgi:formylglycine-generating enzyme required for sulfatase activity
MSDRPTALAGLAPIAEGSGEALPDAIILEDPVHLELMRVPGGEFTMGSDPSHSPWAKDAELPQHTLSLPEFYIGRYPVTNGQYEAFVGATWRRRPVHWESEGVPEELNRHPVVDVCWHDALAFATWLGEETGLDCDLPSEAEWERAARGTDGRLYPWGDEPPTADLGNFDANIRETTPVGRYSPQGDSPVGCVDMAGNVWEWTRSLWGPAWDEPQFTYPYDAEDGREDIDASSKLRRVIRGGSYGSKGWYVRCAYRNWLKPRDHYKFYGFRIVVFP